MRLLLSILFSGRTLTAATLMIMNIALRTQAQVPKYIGELSGAFLDDPYSAIAGNYAYVASEGSDALEIIDIANPATPVHKGSIAHGTGGALLSRPKSVVVLATTPMWLVIDLMLLKLWTSLTPLRPYTKERIEGKISTILQYLIELHPKRLPQITQNKISKVGYNVSMALHFTY